ncbi:MAG: hypothetical protein KF869_12620 [Phycisphaeraceae bacterium]|nr:hypothetical protein [Phycisphaeraceae bacterium]
MLKDLCTVRRMGVVAAAAVSVAGSVLLIYNLVTPQSVQMMRTADLVALVAMLLLPVLTLATMRGAARTRRSAAVPMARTSTHGAETDSANRSATRHRRRAQSGAQSPQ